ncbi:electron transfer flavoprotein subunit beta/FixA family protein [Geobacillus thermodenitrificans]|uniref:electron transfer flavoprotein subunit beta/FixA family protein n=1 Tax=Geobacillus thermodenitrificans TaxID=33940 RepID=UPI002E1F8294|nr:electron transfer flavoprotein subunit beta/FixA family protein [Geobacillus thermodenitrificans]
MNIIVLMKQTFDTEEKITIQNGQIVKDHAAFIINPYDEYAIEEAIRLKEKHGGEVTVMTIGSSEAESSLRTALAMGADKAVLIEEDEDQLLDEYSIAKILATAIKEREYDIILCGNMSVDNGASQVGPRVAEELDIAHISTVVKLEIDGELVKAERDVEGDMEMVESSLPILVTAQQGLNEPRYPSLPGIMKAKKKPIERLDIEDLGLNEQELEAKSIAFEHYLPPKKEAGRILTGELSDQVKELVHLLRNEAKVVSH